MPQYTNLSQGTPFWVDLSSPDIAASMSFYANLFGWGYEEAPLGGRRGKTLRMGEETPPDIPPELLHWITKRSHLARNLNGASNCWSTTWTMIVSRIADFGGSIVQAPVEGRGVWNRRADFADPTGGRVNIWQAFQSGPTIKHEHGSRCSGVS